jgi:hypothetical protein
LFQQRRKNGVDQLRALRTAGIVEKDGLDRRFRGLHRKSGEEQEAGEDDP